MRRPILDLEYWDTFGRIGTTLGGRPSPQQAADTVLHLMAEVDRLAAEVTRLESERGEMLSALEAPVLRLMNDVEAVRARWRARKEPSDG